MESASVSYHERGSDVNGAILTATSVPAATGEHAHNRMCFKQLLAAEAIDVCQIDSCRLAGINEILSVLLMAAKKGVPVCPHAGGVGLTNYVVHCELYGGRRARFTRTDSQLVAQCPSSTTSACLARRSETSSSEPDPLLLTL